MSENKQDKQNTRSFVDLTEDERQEIAELIRTARKSYRQILQDYNIKNLSVVVTIKKKYVTREVSVPRERKPMSEKQKDKIRKSALAVAQVNQHEIVSGRELSLLDGILFNMEHLIKIVNFHDDKTTEAIEKVKEIHELLSKHFKPDSVTETKQKFSILGAIVDMLNRLETFIQAHNTQIKAIAEIRQQSDHFVKHRNEIIGRDGVIRMIDDIFYCLAQLDEPSYRKFRETIKSRSPLAWGLLAKMEDKMLERSTEESTVDNNKQDE